MANWTNVSNTVLDVGKPVRSIDITAIKENIIAAFEGAAGAPALAHAALLSSVIGASKLAAGSSSGVANVPIVFAGAPYTSYPNKLLVVQACGPVTNAVALALRVSTDGGSSYDSGGANYQWVLQELNAFTPAQTLDHQATSDSEFRLTRANITNTTANNLSSLIWLPHTTIADQPVIRASTWYLDSTNVVPTFSEMSGRRTTGQDTDAVQLRMTSGNMSLTWALYGLNP